MTALEHDDELFGDEPFTAPGKVNRISQQFSAFPVAMLESPAWRVASKSCRLFVDRLAIELSRHAGKDNGALPVTYDDCIEHGICDYQSVRQAQREAEALGFCECTERGRGGNATWRKASLWRVTFLLSKNLEMTHEWSKIKTLAEAKAIAQRARAAKEKKARPKLLRKPNRRQAAAA